MWCLSVLKLEILLFSHCQNIDKSTLSKSYFSLSMLSRKDDLCCHKSTFFTWQTDNNCSLYKNQNVYFLCFQNYSLLPLDIIIALHPFRSPAERRSMVPPQDQDGTLVQTWQLMHHTPSKRSILRNLDLRSHRSNGNDNMIEEQRPIHDNDLEESFRPSSIAVTLNPMTFRVRRAHMFTMVSILKTRVVVLSTLDW